MIDLTVEIHRNDEGDIAEVIGYSPGRSMPEVHLDFIQPHQVWVRVGRSSFVITSYGEALTILEPEK